jgi:hypothetical protein
LDSIPASRDRSVGRSQVGRGAGSLKITLRSYAKFITAFPEVAATRRVSHCREGECDVTGEVGPDSTRLRDVRAAGTSQP